MGQNERNINLMMSDVYRQLMSKKAKEQERGEIDKQTHSSWIDRGYCE